MANTGNTQQIIDYGATANDGTGDPLRTAFIKTDENFSNIWAAGPVGSNITIANNTIQNDSTNGNIILKPNGVGVIQANASILPSISGARDLGSNTRTWRRAYIDIMQTQDLELTGNISVAGDAVIQGNLTVEGDTIQIGNITTDTLLIQLANAAANGAQANGAGVTVGANDDIATMLYNSGSNAWNFNIGLSATGNISAPYFIGNGSQLTGLVTVGGANTQIQYNNNGALAGDAGLTYNPANNTIRVSGIGTSGEHSATFGASGYTELNANVVVQITANANSYSQVNFQNINDGPQATTDYIATASSGTDSTYFVDMGIASNSYDSANVYNSLGNSLYPQDSYLYSMGGNSGGGTGGNLVVGSNEPGGVVRIIADGSALDNVVATFSNVSIDVKGNIIPTANGVYSLGNSTNYWANLWVANNTIYIGGVPLGMTAGNVLTVDGQDVITTNANGTIDLANLAVDDNNIYNTQGQGVVISNFSFIAEAETAYVQIPAGNSSSDLSIVQKQGNVKIAAGGSDWKFDNNGNLTAPGAINVGDMSIGELPGYITANANTAIIVNVSGPDGGFVVDYLKEDGNANTSQGELAFSSETGNTTYRISLTDDAGDGFATKIWRFDGTGNLTLPSGGNIIIDGGDGVIGPAGDNLIISWDNENLTLRSIGDDIELQTPYSVRIETGDAGEGEYSGRWDFSSDNGKLNSLPVNPGFGYWNAGHLQFVGNSSGDNNGYTTLRLVPDDTLIGNDQYLIIDPTAPGHIHIRAGGEQDNSNADLFLGGEYTHFKVTAGANNQARIMANSWPWTFGADGTFTLPANAELNGSQINSVANSSGDGVGYTTLQLIPDVTIGTGTDQYLIIDPTAPGHIHIRAGGTQDDSSADLILGGENSHVKVTAGLDPPVYVRANNQSWTFTTDGVFQTPGDISVNGNVTANYFIGDGSQLTGLPASYGNANVVANLAALSSNPISTTGNITADNFIGSGNANVLTLTTRNGDSNNSYASPQIIMGYAGTADYPSFIHTTHNASTPVDNTIEFWTSDGTQAGTFPTNAVLGLTVTNGNIETGNISATGNITAGNFIGSGTNVDIIAGSYDWTFDSAGTLTLPGNTFAVNYANGTAVTLGGNYGNANVATFLAAYGSNTISTTGNISAGNVTLTGNLTVNGSPIYGAPASFAKYTRTTTQTGIVANTVIVCNVLENTFGSDITVNTSTGNVTLAPNLTYRVRGTAGALVNNGNPAGGAWRWYNVTSGSYVGGFGTSLAPAASNYNTGAIDTAEVVITPGVTTVLQLQMVTVSNMGTIGSGTSVEAGYPWIDIEVIGGQAPITGFSTTGNVTGGNLIVSGTANTGVNALLAGPTFTPLANTVAGFVANVNNYSQVTFQNRNAGADATADFILTADNGSDTVNYGDFGIINSGYDVNTPTNSLGNIVSAGDSYLYAQGNVSNTSQSGGNLAIGTTVAGKSIKLFAGGNTNAALVANISNTGISVAGNVTASNFIGNISITGNVQGTSANVQLVAGSYTYTFDNTGVATFPAIGGNEGGELNFGIPTANTTLTGPVKFDVFQDRIRFFESSANAKGAYIDLAQSSSGAGTLLNNRVSAANLALNTSLTFDNLAIQIRAQSSGVWIFAATVSGTATYQYSITYQLNGANAQGTTGSISATTTPATIGSNAWYFNSAALSVNSIITDTTNNRMYRVTWQTTTGSSPYGNFVSIERLV